MHDNSKKIQQAADFVKKIAHRAGACSERVFRVLKTWIKPGAHVRPDPVTDVQKTRIKRFVVATATVFFVTAFAASFEFHITCDGKDVTANRYTSLAELYQSATPVTPGNFIAVDGSIITPGAGDLYSAHVNGHVLSALDARAYIVGPNDDIQFFPGLDVVESYTVEKTQAIEPKLERQGEVGSVSYVAQWPKEGVQETRHGATSNIVADVVATPPENAIIVTKNIHPKDGEKIVALTFDDGPSEYTERYLDILKSYGAHATFFELGAEVAKRASVTKAVKEAGMQVGTHTYGHEVPSKTSPEDLQRTLRQGIAVLKDDAGVQTSMLRPPYGDFTSDAWLHSAGIISSAITWTQDSRDWSLPGASAIVSHALANIQPGSIILMHDGGGNRDQDLEALPQILQTLTDQGYRVLSVSELLTTDTNIPLEVALGTATLPDGAVWPTECAN